MIPTHTRHLSPFFLELPLIAVCLIFSFVNLGSVLQASEPTPPVRQIKITDRLPYGLPPVDYSRKDVDDVIAKLNRQLATQKTRLRFQGPNGYLKSVLKSLDVSVESQLLVFSKTALNQHRVGPKNPRVIYFNDEVYVGWVPGAGALEISTVDPKKGSNFYTLTQQKTQTPQFAREESCLACHAGRTTLNVPGHMIRTFQVKKNGKPVSGYSRITHETAYSKRWGGWYVTGRHGKMSHWGNLIGEKQNYQFRNYPSRFGNIIDLKPFLDVSKYLSPHSDIVAHMVLDHQSHGHNLITRVNFESRFGRRSDAESQLLRYLLFVDEAKLTASVTGTSGYSKHFEKRGKRDRQNRSLRDFNLKTRLFKYRLSFLIQTNAFRKLPEDVKKRIYLGLWNVLTGKDRSSEFQHIPLTERTAIRTILVETKTDLPGYWHAKPLPK